MNTNFNNGMRQNDKIGPGFMTGAGVFGLCFEGLR